MNGNEHVPTVLGEGDSSWRSTAVGLTHMLVLPQGFTLAIAGSLTICLGRHGYPGPLGVWLFVAGASAGYCLLVLAFGALRPTVSQPVGIVGLALLNVTAVVVVPLVALLGWWIPNADLAYLVTGLAVHLTYIPLVAATIILLARPAQQEPVTNASPIRPLGRGVSGHW
ncbi:MAG: hypothetical protein ABI438_10850 [Dermatophilaceae bacterium]